MSWTEEKVSKLKELWGKGNTASQIAQIIGGISRNAVIGKAHRLNLSAKIKTRTATSNQNFENSSDEKNTDGQLKSVDVCLFLIIFPHPKRGKNRKIMNNCFMNIVFIII